MSVQITVKNPKAYSMFLFGGCISAAEAYIRGYWETNSLETALQIFVRNSESLCKLDDISSQFLNPIRMIQNRFRDNTRKGSRKNISAHYDLSNEMFSLMLDDTMAYSSGIFKAEDSSLEEASLEKFDRLCRKLNLSEGEHLLEIGTGWGGFAIYAAQNYNCKVTTTTISQQQYDYVEQKIKSLGLENQITLLLKDYRDLEGQYDKLVSIEMIEAVGEKFLDTYFSCCSNLLKPSGVMAIQAITIPDYKYDTYRKSPDFINTYIFPGGFLPSYTAITNSLQKKTDLQLIDLADFSWDYAQTLKHWRKNFFDNIEEIQKQDFDDRFIRTWHYYLCYCEAGFIQRNIAVSQIVMAKPKNEVKKD